METLVEKTFYLLGNYEDLTKGNDMDSRLFVGGQILGAIKTIVKLQGEIIDLKRPEKKNGDEVTDEMIKRAREYTYDQLIEVDRNKMAICPFHDDRNPSFSIKGNKGRCFGCGWKGDTIEFMRQRDGLSFIEAVRRLQ